MTQLFAPLLLNHTINAILLLVELLSSAVPISPQTSHAALTSVLYLPTISQPAFLQVTWLVDFRESKFSLNTVVKGEFISHAVVPIYHPKVRVTGFDPLGHPFATVIATTYLTATFPGQLNGFKAVFEHPEGDVFQAEVISWTMTSPQTYLTPSVVFTPSTEDVNGVIFNNTGITLTNITIATWSLEDRVSRPDVATALGLSPDQTLSFTRSFIVSAADQISPASIRVVVQGVASS